MENKRFINPTYLQKKVIARIKNSYLKSASKSLRLESFFRNAVYNKLENAIKKLKFKYIKIPDRHSHSEVKLNKEINEIFNSKEFINFAQEITHKKTKKINVSTKKFKHGDYTLIHDSELKNKRIEFFFFICHKWKIEFGGNKVYVKGNKSFVFAPTKNTLVIIKREKSDKNFVQYINHRSGKRGVILIEGVLTSVV